MADSIRTLFRRSILENLRKSRFQTGIILDCLDPWGNPDSSMGSCVCQMADTDGNRNKEGITFRLARCALNQASGKLTVFEHDEIVVVREACDEIPDSLLQLAQTQIDDHANDAANDGRPYVGRTVETRASCLMRTDWHYRA